MFNRLIFPQVPPSYGCGSLVGELMHVPRKLAAAPVDALNKAAAAAYSPQKKEEGDAAAATPDKQQQQQQQHDHIPATLLSPAFFDFGAGLFIRSPNAASAQHVVIYLHPNAVDCGMMRGEFVHMARTLGNVHCFLVEYQGYGLLAASSPSEQQVTEDTFAGTRFVRDVLGVPHSRMILMGRSIGGGAVCNAAAMSPDFQRDPPLHVLLQCPFTSIKETVRALVNKGAAKGMLGDIASEMVGERFSNIKNLPKIKCPVTIIHGQQDDICPYPMAGALVQAAKDAGKHDVRLITVDSGHNDLPIKPGFEVVKEVVAKAKAKASDESASSSSSSGGVSIERARPYLAGSAVLLQTRDGGRSRPAPLDATKPVAHIAQTLTYNTLSFMSLVRASWEAYLLCRDEAASIATGSEQVLSYLSMFASSVNLRLPGSVGDRSHLAAEQWRLADYVELCAFLWGSPLSLGVLESAADNKEKGDADADADKKQQTNKRLLVFGTTVPLGRAATAFNNNTGDGDGSSSGSSGHEATSHYDELWTASMATAWRKTLEKILAAQDEAKRLRENAVIELEQQKQSATTTTTTTITSAASDASESEKSSLTTTAATSTAAASSSKVAVPPPVSEKENPAHNTAALLAGLCGAREAFSPLLLWKLPPTLLKIVCDNIDKCKRGSIETMKRVAETMGAKPLPTSDRGALWLQVEMERFVLSCLATGQMRGDGDGADEKRVFDIMHGVLSNSSQQQKEDDEAVVAWRAELRTLLSSPFLDSVLVPLPLTVEASDAMKALLAHYRNAPAAILVQPATPAPDNGSGGGAGKKQPQAADCVIA